MAGTEEKEICGRDGCDGIIELREKGSCSCHINPPCSSCTEARAYCPVCGWDENDDKIFNDYRVSVDKKTGNFTSWEPRKLDNTKIDWHSKSNTHSSMIKEGVYPEGTTMKQVAEKVKGTFGGKFRQFGGGRFIYIAYTD